MPTVEAKSASHTPGPWVALDIGEVWSVADDGVTIVDQIAGICTDENDAALIAAAPDLLEALQAARIKLRRYREYHPDTWVGGVEAEYQAVLRVADAAIARAQPA